MFHFLEAQTAQQRLNELERFIEYWYGPRQAAYGEPEERLALYPLPAPLHRFYAFAGRWPPPPEGTQAAEFIYSGAGGHHMQPLDYVELRPEGRLEFFMEYQGDWVGLTLPSQADPPVWLQGRFFEDEASPPETPGTRLACDSLSRFLVTHCLMTSVYEDSNHACMAFARADSPLVAFLLANPAKVEKLWDCSGCRCPWYEGAIYLIPEGVLVHQAEGKHTFAAHPLLPAAVQWLEELKKQKA
jgi:hypothetical protein